MYSHENLKHPKRTQACIVIFVSGMVSVRSEANVMVKNMLDVSLGGAAYWFVGYGFSFGPNSKASSAMSGEGHFITDVDISDSSDEAYIYIKYFFQLSFATTATTIVSGKGICMAA